jgi:hypothetical protein
MSDTSFTGPQLILWSDFNKSRSVVIILILSLKILLNTFSLKSNWNITYITTIVFSMKQTFTPLVLVTSTKTTFFHKYCYWCLFSMLQRPWSACSWPLVSSVGTKIIHFDRFMQYSIASCASMAYIREKIE